MSTPTESQSSGNFPSRRRKVTITHAESEEQAFKSQLLETQMFKVVVDGDDGGVAMRQVFERVDTAVLMRSKFLKKESDRGLALLIGKVPQRAVVTESNGIYQVSDHQVSLFGALQPWSVFAQDVEQLRLTVGNTMCSKACGHRLDIIQERSRMFFLLNADIEEKQNARKAGGIFSRVIKVDNSIKLGRAMNAQELLDFVVDSYQRFPQETVGKRADNPQESLTLKEMFDQAGVSDPSELTVEALGWHPRPNRETEHMVDKEPLSAAIRRVFLKFEGAMTARLVKRLISRGEVTRNTQGTEMSIAVYGTYKTEIVDIANFLQRNEIGPAKRNMWMLQLRFFDKAPDGRAVECRTIQEQLDFIFLPLLHASIHPEDPKNSSIAWLLSQVGGLLLESSSPIPGSDFDKNAKIPSKIRYKDPKPSELYFAYYVYANLVTLNSVRRRNQQNTLQLRIAGTNVDRLLAGYLFCDVITQCDELASFSVFQYLYGIHGVGLTVSPLSSNATGTPYKDHPLPLLLHRCMAVSISTEMPMQNHHSSNALLEEYSTAQAMFRLSALDMTEIARNSVVMSSFPQRTKNEWLGDTYNRGAIGNVFETTQVTNVRLQFREESWDLEREMFKELYRAKVPETADGLKAQARVVGPAGLSRWHMLSTVKDVEYNTVMDNRIRFPRTVLNGPHKEMKSAIAAAPKIARCIELRAKYTWDKPKPWEVRKRANVEADFQRHTATFNEDDWTYAGSDAVYISYPKNVVHAWPRHLPTIEDFHRDLLEIKATAENPVVKDFAHRRLEFLEHKYRLHLALNHANEAGMTADQATTNRDIYQATKVDTHIHMAAGMTPRQMLQFVVRKLEDNSDDIAMKKGNNILTLGRLMRDCCITKNLTVDQLNVQADHTLFERFDNFNNKYNPMESPDLRTLLLKTDNFMNGRYFAELIRDVFEQYSKDKFTYAENRLSIYGMNMLEWGKLSSWFATHGMAFKHNKWIVQIPRVYKVFRVSTAVGSFGQYLQNIFEPLWEASLHPSDHPTLHHFLNHVSGFDSVDNEATIDLPFEAISPWAWTSTENPPYNYYVYYLYANIRMLNEFRASRGFSTFDLRPHCGESGSIEHLHGAFLCASGIGHGINLKHDVVLQYLYYLAQIGLHVSPLSNNALFLYFLSNPFPEFFRRGLNVSLSTDDPMMFHQTQEPLIEEYSVAARVWGFSPNDLCEIARNSVLQCGFDYQFKRDAIGDRWYMHSSLGNDPRKTHLSDIRVAFRFETYHTECAYLELCSGQVMCRAMLTTHQEQEINESESTQEAEEIILSTHDQAMEVAFRDIEGKRDQIRLAKVQIDSLRRQQKSLIDNITEVGIRRQQQKEREEREGAKKERLVYRRPLPEAPKDPAADNTEAATRLLGWKPLPPTQSHRVTSATVSATPSRPLPSSVPSTQKTV